jgi:DNA-binding NarL/FixJ family response regulator
VTEENHKSEAFNTMDHHPPIKILIVDDSKLTRVSLKTTLAMAKNQILLMGEAEEGREAITLAEKLRPDLVLMDVGMPILDGIRATQEIRRKFPEMKVIMLTSHESEEDILESFRSGATSYCLKDTPPDMLLQVILSTHQGACWIDPKIAKVVLKSLNPTATMASKSESIEASEPSTFGLLTERERDVLKLITQGLNNTEISEKLCLSPNTVKTHIKNIFQKLEVEDRTAAALKAIKERIV